LPGSLTTWVSNGNVNVTVSPVNVINKIVIQSIAAVAVVTVVFVTLHWHTALSALCCVLRCHTLKPTDTLLHTYMRTHCCTTLLSTGPLLNKSIAKLGPQVPYYIAMYTKRSSSSSNSSSSELACRDKCGFETATTYISPQHGALDWLLVPSFLYSYAIEDPLVDSKFLNFQENDALLLLTTGYVLYFHYNTY
jgi:hypothetical protein